MRRATTPSRRRATALIIVLWTVVLLSIILTNFAYMVRTHTRIASNFADSSVLSASASAGIERAIAELQLDMQKPDTLRETWSDDEDEFEKVEIGDGTFTLLRFEDVGENVEARYGLEDECGKLNLRTATREMLTAIGLTNEQASAVLDWQDGDDTPQPEGAEYEYYTGFDDPYPPKNAPLATLQELMQLRGFDPLVLYGEDWNQNGQLDPNENDGDETLPPDDQNGVLDRGLLPHVTLWSIDKEQTMNDSARLDLNSADETALRNGIPGLNEKEAKAIVNHRQKNQFENVGQLLQVKEVKEEQPQAEGNPPPQPQGETPNQPEGAPPPNNNGNPPPNGAQPNASQPQEGDPIFNRDRVKQIIDFVKVGNEETKQGRVNLNTASARVLQAIPGISKQTADSIVQAREKEQRNFNNIADLFDMSGVSDDDFMKASPHLTVRSYVFRARSVATIEGVKSTRTIVAILDRSEPSIKIRYWNEQ
jgi:competence ComEA-like helix-hairpin-helix protein